jgi:hypothetical protein
MRKSFILAIVLMAAIAWSAPKVYHVKKLPTGSAPTVDGTVTEWNESYFIDTLDSDANVYFESSSPWTASEIQMRVYAAHDDAKVYWAVKITSDNVVNICGATHWSGGCDNLKFNPGGTAAAFYLYSANIIFKNPSSPYTVNSDLWASANATGNGTFPTYEIALSKTIVDMFGFDSIAFSVGTEDEDLGGACYAAVGAYYLGNKLDDASNPWNNVNYYPYWVFVTTPGDPLAVEQGHAARLAIDRLSASPNPFMPSTVLSYNAGSSGTLKIYDVNGKVIRNFSTQAGAGKTAWDGTDACGRSVSSGIYIARLTNGKNVLDTRLFLTR